MSDETDPQAPINIARINAEIGKLMAEMAKVNAEGEKFRRETPWYPIAVVAGVAGAVGALVAALTRRLGGA